MNLERDLIFDLSFDLLVLTFLNLLELKNVILSDKKYWCGFFFFATFLELIFVKNVKNPAWISKTFENQKIRKIRNFQKIILSENFWLSNFSKFVIFLKKNWNENSENKILIKNVPKKCAEKFFIIIFVIIIFLPIFWSMFSSDWRIFFTFINVLKNC